MQEVCQVHASFVCIDTVESIKESTKVNQKYADSITRANKHKGQHEK
jgi:hypothetical protein